AVEHRVSIVRAANTGVSAFIAPSGIIVRRLHLFERGVMTESVPLRARRTLFTRLGDWLGLLSLAVTTAAVAGTWRRGGRGGRGGGGEGRGFARPAPGGGG